MTTERLGFGFWQEDDLDLARGLWGDPAVTRLIGGPWTEEQIRARLEEEIATQTKAGVQYWPLFVLESGEHAGCCGLRPCDPLRRVLELGVHIRSSCWHRGYAVEAATAVIDFAFRELGVSALFAGHHPENAASRALLSKLGFRYTHDELYPPTGLQHPSYLMERL